MNVSISKIILEKHLNNYSSTILLVFDNDGIIHHANDFVKNLTGQQLSGSHLKNVFLSFGPGKPWDDIPQSPTEIRLMNITTLDGNPETYYFRFYLEEELTIAIGELDQKEMQALRKNMINLNTDLSNKTRELQKKNIELEQLNKIKNKFLGIAAHDLRSPLNSILGFCELLTDYSDAFDELKKGEFLDGIRSSANFMLSLINDLLDVTKIEYGALEINLEFIDVNHLFQKVIDVNQMLANKKKINIAFHPLSSPYLFPLDGLRLLQVMNNLLSNAIKFSEPHTEINVSIEDINKKLQVAVSDQGPGIPEEELSMLFKVFSQTSIKSKDGEASSGLGLAICKKIIEKHGGEIKVASRVGHGTTFSFTLPVSERKEKL